MTAPLNVTQKLATAKSWQNNGSNLNEFQAWLGTIPADAYQYAGQQHAIAGQNSGDIWIRQPGLPIIALNATDWLVIVNDSNTNWYKMTDQDYQKAWG